MIRKVMPRRGILSLVVMAGALWGQACFSNNITVERVDPLQTLEKERAVFIKSYSYFYKDIASDLEISDMTKALKRRFDDEVSLLKNDDKKIYALRVQQDDNVVAFVSLAQESETQLRMRRCAIDLESNVDDVVKTLIQFLFHASPKIALVTTVVLKKSVVEIEMLTKFGFAQGGVLPDGYDKELYENFVLIPDVFSK